jgi:hypothetical protein
MMPKNTFRLGAHDGAHYLHLFDLTAVSSVRPELCRRFGWSDQASAKVGEGDLEFDVYMNAANGVVAPDQLEAARSVLSQIVEMDDTARSIPTDLDHDEVLARVKLIDVNKVRFRYFATTVNTEWDVDFTLNVNGAWECAGIVPPRQ